MTEMFSGFPQPLQSNSEVMLQQPLPSTPSQYTIFMHYIISHKRFNNLVIKTNQQLCIYVYLRQRPPPATSVLTGPLSTALCPFQLTLRT